MRDIRVMRRKEPQSENAKSPQTNIPVAPTPVGPRAPYKKKRSIIFSAAGVLLLLLIVVALYFLVFRGENASERELAGIAKEYQNQLPGLKAKVDESPKDTAARKNYAIALYATQDYNGARSQYEEVIKLDNKDAVAYNNLANTYRDLNQTDKAIEAYQKSIKLDSKIVNTYANLANVQLYTNNDTEAAIATYKEGIKALPDNTQLQLLLAIAYQQAGNTSEAKATYEAILKIEPGNATARAGLEKLREK